MHTVFRLGLFAALIWFVWAILDALFLSGDPHGLEKLSQWGGSFGGLSALISAAGFIAVVWSIRKQQVDQHRQRFYSNYIELLKLLREVRSDVRFRYGDTYRQHHKIGNDVQQGLRAFRAAWKEVEFYIQNTDTSNQIRDWYISRVHDRYEGNLGPYFRLLYTILNNIKEDKILDSKEKEIYGNLLRSQLTSFELVIVGLNGMAPISKNMWSLVVEFRILRYIPDDNRKQVLQKCYPTEVFLPRS